MAMRSRLIFTLLLLPVAILALNSTAHGWQSNEPVPNWIWSPKHRAGHVPQTSCYFRKTISLPESRDAKFAIAADDVFELYINGKLAAQGTGENGILTYDVKPLLRAGDNTFALKVTNRDGATAGLAARLVLRDTRDQEVIHVTDGSWKTSLSSTVLWNRATFFELGWAPARTLGPFSNFLSQQLAAQREAAAGQDSTTQASNNPGPTAPPARNNPPAMAQGKTAADANATANTSTNTNTTANPSAAGSTPNDVYQPLARKPAAGEQLEIPREFELQHIAGHLDIGSLTAMTFDEFGTLIVAREDGQLWQLVDRDDDGVFDARRDYGKLTNTCQGMLTLNGELYMTGMADGELGLFRLTDTDQDGKLDAKQRIIKFRGDNIEHGPHGITLGPDGKLYVMVGNHSPMDEAFAASSPYRYAYEGDLLQPRFQDPGGHASSVEAPGGYILRTDPNGERAEIFAGGFRNAYDLAFNRRGALFTHDSDMESDRGSTWYRPTRVYHVVDGGEYGWRSGWAKWPEYFIDNLPGIGDTGRGSPTGMVVYDHDKFPSVYRNALFSCDWSEGRILVFACSEDGASYKALGKPFIQGQPLNVTDIEVGPDGALYFVTGGRGTAGNVYRVAWKGAEQQPQQSADDQVVATIDTVLRQPQMHSSWARQQIAAAHKQLGSRWETLLVEAARDQSRPEQERVQALQVMQWIGSAPSLTLLTELASDRRVAVRRQVAFQLGLQPTAASSRQVTLMLADPDPVVRRRASEALARHTYPVAMKELRKPLASSDRFEAWAARRVLETVPREMWQEELLTTDNQRVFLQGATALLLSSPTPQHAQAVIERSQHFMNGFVNDDSFVDMLRVQQLAFLRTQVPAAARAQFARRLADEYPSSSATINRELIRLLMYLQVDQINDRYLAELQRDWPLPDKLHLAIHLTYLKQGWTTDQKLAVFQYLASPPGAGNSLPGYLQNAAHQFGSLLSSEELAQALERGHENPGSALAAMLRMPEKLSDQQMASIRDLDQRIRDRDDEMTRRLKVAVLAILARDGSRPATQYLREVYDRDPARRGEVALGLAETDDEANWPYLVRSLPILEPTDARDVLIKLRGYAETPRDADAYRQVILVAQRLGENGAEHAIALLEHWQGYASNDQSIAWQQALTAWKGWFKDQYPNEPVPEMVVSSERGKWDEAALLKHLTRAEQEAKGSVSAGAQVFVKAQCASCHRFGSQGESMGPDLTGISKRFLKREILDSMLYPSKVISDQYAAKTVYTNDGKIYTGIVSETPGNELLVLQMNGTKVRLPQSEVDEIEPARTSAMPEGLLNELSLTEITDLFAYLQSDPDRFTLKPSSGERQ
jgi:putative heme-binding domain-containing protein